VFLQDLIKRRPVFAPFTSPIYSNDAFGVLSFALESITNKPFTDMMDNMFDQLGLSQTSYTTPSSDVILQGVIPWNISYRGWDTDEPAGDPFVIQCLVWGSLNNSLHIGPAPSTPRQQIFPISVDPSSITPYSHPLKHTAG
jgi:CubicO group peptidase (beta-lactamase class C family)